MLQFEKVQSVRPVLSSDREVVGVHGASMVAPSRRTGNVRNGLSLEGISPQPLGEARERNWFVVIIDERREFGSGTRDDLRFTEPLDES